MFRKGKLLLVALGIIAAVALVNLYYVRAGGLNCDAGDDCPLGTMFCDCHLQQQCGGNLWPCDCGYTNCPGTGCCDLCDNGLPRSPACDWTLCSGRCGLEDCNCHSYIYCDKATWYYCSEQYWDPDNCNDNG